MAQRPKNKTARDKQLARERARRNARKRDEHPLYYLQPPFKPYSEWFSVPAHAADHFEHPARHDPRLDQSAKDLLDTVTKLGPRYEGNVPMAAVYLDHQIREGIVRVAVTGRRGECVEVPLAQLASEVSAPDFLDQMRSKYPGAVAEDETASPITDEGAAWYVHELHMRGALVMDDDLIMNLVVLPKQPEGEWLLNGHVEN